MHFHTAGGDFLIISQSLKKNDTLHTCTISPSIIETLDTVNALKDVADEVNKHYLKRITNVLGSKIKWTILFTHVRNSKYL